MIGNGHLLGNGKAQEAWFQSFSSRERRTGCVMRRKNEQAGKVIMIYFDEIR